VSVAVDGASSVNVGSVSAGVGDVGFVRVGIVRVGNASAGVESAGIADVDSVSEGIVNVAGAGVCVCATGEGVTGLGDSKESGAERDTPGSRELDSPESNPPRTAGASRPSSHSSTGVKIRGATVVTSFSRVDQRA